MKKIIMVTISVILLMACFHCSAEIVLKQTITISFPEVDRDGVYTGEVNEAGVPDGFGVFEATNSDNNRYIIVGNWENGKITGESWKAYEDGEQYIGIFEDSVFIKGKYVVDAKIAQYDRALDTGYGYTADSLFDMNWDKLDDGSIIRLISNTFGGNPINKEKTGYIWLVNGSSKFCDLDIVAIWASVDDTGKIISISYMMKSGNYYDLVDDVRKDLELMDILVSRINARIGKTGIITLNDETQTHNLVDEYIMAQTQFKLILDRSVMLSYSWDYKRGVLFNATDKDGTVLVVMKKD